MVLAGLLLDHVQHWKVFKEVPELFILVPALLGLKGNLEMTLASRLSTAANLGILDNFANAKIIGNVQKLTFLEFFSLDGVSHFSHKTTNFTHQKIVKFVYFSS